VGCWIFALLAADIDGVGRRERRIKGGEREGGAR